jgi:membrane-associated protein
MVDIFKEVIHCVLHFNGCLQTLIAQYDTWIYLILFLMIFCETGLVVTPFIPGDSLLFATGLLAGQSGNPLNIELVALLLMSAAFLGDNTNYFIGSLIGKKVYEKDYRLIKRKYLIKTHEFYEKHGGKTIIFAKFMPIVRTFAPFVAGIGSMTYKRFVSHSVIGNILWVNIFAWGGFIANMIPFIRNNFEIAISIILLVSLVPAVWAGIRSKIKSYRENKLSNTTIR